MTLITIAKWFCPIKVFLVSFLTDCVEYEFDAPETILIELLEEA